MHHGDAIREFIQPSSQIFAWSYIINWRIAIGSFAVVPKLVHHFWSLSIEEQFYLVWPFMVRRVAKRGLMIVCGALFVVSPACRVVLQLLHRPEAAYVVTICRLDSLAIGAIVAITFLDCRYWKMVRSAASYLIPAAMSGLIAIAFTTRSVSDFDFWMETVGLSLWAILFGGCLVKVLEAPSDGLIYGLASSGILQMFGKYSYCLYICHQPLIILFAKVGINAAEFAKLFHSKMLAVVAVNGIALSVALAISLASWHCFEKYFLKLKESTRLRGEATRAQVQTGAWVVPDNG